MKKFVLQDLDRFLFGKECMIRLLLTKGFDMMTSLQPFCLRWIACEHDSGKLLRTFLIEQSISKRALTDIKFDGGKLSVNGLEVTVRYLLQAGDQIEVIFPVEKSSEGLIPEHLPLSIQFEDEFVLIVNKPSAMNTIPSREHPSGSLANALAGYYVKQNLASTVHVVTRLDRDTSGLVLIAKHRHVHHLLSEQQKSGRIRRRYEAVAEGIIKAENGTIEAPIGRNPNSIIEREVREDGKDACTNYHVLSRQLNHTHLSLQLLTGRTHQIRVHMAYIGHPLAGDDLYGGHLDWINRQALHCCELTFLHPFTGEALTFHEKLPEDIKKLL
jgi:23S rRNA pseudouridine1911/1915/1917 synthase